MAEQLFFTCHTSHHQRAVYFTNNDQQVRYHKEIANEFNKYFVNIGTRLTENIELPYDKKHTDYLLNPSQTVFEFKPITIDNVTRTIDSLKPKSSKGIDKISNKLLKFVKKELVSPITNLINNMFRDGEFPDALKVAKVTPIYKDKDIHQFQNYRPISILSSVSKVFERIIYNQIYEHLKSNNLLYKSPHGFRTLHSTETASLELLDNIITEMDKNNCPINVYMDLSKAFDTLDHNILLDKLAYYGIRQKSLQLLRSYLCNRKQYVQYNDTISEPLNIMCGVPQGSILGPLLFII